MSPSRKSVQAEIFTSTGEPVVGGGGALATRPRPLGDRHPLLAFVERRLGSGLTERTGVSLPPVGGSRTAGPTSGQWGSG